MKWTIRRLLTRRRTWSFRLCGMLVLLASVLHPGLSFAQRARVQNLTPSSIGGTTQGVGSTLRSSAGEAAPVGETEGGSFTVQSAWIVILPSNDAAPQVSHTPPGTRPANQDVLIGAAVEDVSAIKLARLFFRRGGEETFTAVEMEADGDQFVSAIPARMVTSEGAAYYLTVTDESNRMTRTPTVGVFSVRVAVPEPGISMDEPIAGGNDESAYRIVSIPLDLDNKDAGAVLADDLGAYDNTRWRFFQLLFDQSLAEFPGTTAMTPGKGFWLITSEGERRIDSGAGTTVDLGRPFSIQLHPGWNLVGTPFHFPISVESLRMKSGQLFLLRSFSGHWNDPIQAPVEVLEPLSGYAIFNNLHIVDELLVDPDVAASKNDSRMRAGFQPDWAIRIIAQSGKARDADNIAAVAAGVSLGLDPNDYPEPPVIGSFVSVYFPHPEWGTPTDRYATDVRPQNLQGYEWDVEVRGNVRDPVRMHFDGVDDVPDHFGVWLVDELLHHAVDLRLSDVYTLSSATADIPRRLRMVVGDADFVREKLEATRQFSDEYELLPSFPNPFHFGTTIRYILPAAANVTLKVFDALGREVVVLAQNEPQEAGHHAVVWQGLGPDLVPLSNGLYYVHLNAGGRVLTTAVVRVK